MSRSLIFCVSPAVTAAGEMSRGRNRRPWCIAPTRPSSAPRRGGALREVMGTSPRVAKIGGRRARGRRSYLNAPVLSGFLLGDVIGGYGVAQACIGAVKACGWTPADTTVAIQGIGTMGAAWHLYEAGTREYLTLPQWRRRSSRRAGSLIVAANAARKISSAASRDPFGQRPHRPGRRIHDCLPATGTHHSCRLSGKGGGVARAITTGRPRCGIGVGVRVRTRR